MKAFWDFLITLATGLATWLAPLDVESALKPIAASGTIIGAGLVTVAYGLHGKQVIADSVGSRKQLVAYVLVCTVCIAAYTAIKRATFTETSPRFWSLAVLLWILTLLLAALFSLVGMLLGRQHLPWRSSRRARHRHAAQDPATRAVRDHAGDPGGRADVDKAALNSPASPTPATASGPDPGTTSRARSSPVTWPSCTPTRTTLTRTRRSTRRATRLTTVPSRRTSTTSSRARGPTGRLSSAAQAAGFPSPT